MWADGSIRACGGIEGKSKKKYIFFVLYIEVVYISSYIYANSKINWKKDMAYKNTRSRVIAGELTDRIRLGEFVRGAGFLTREEICTRYGISPVTAFRVLKQLESDGIISCGRGRRAVLLTGREETERSRLRGCRRIVVAAFTEGEGTPDVELEWAVNFLCVRLRNDGQEAELHRSGIQAGNLPPGDGYLILREQEEAPDLYEELKGSGKPFCMLSSTCLRENTLLIMPRLCLSQLILFFSSLAVKRIHVIRGFSSPADRLLTPPADVILPRDSDIRMMEEGVFTLTRAEDRARLDRFVREDEPGRGDGFFCTNHILGEHLRCEAERQGKKLFISAGTSGLRPDLPGPYIDLKVYEFAESLLSMLYRQFRTGEVCDPGMVLQPEFCEAGAAASVGGFFLGSRGRGTSL